MYWRRYPFNTFDPYGPLIKRTSQFSLISGERALKIEQLLLNIVSTKCLRARVQKSNTSWCSIFDALTPLVKRHIIKKPGVHNYKIFRSQIHLIWFPSFSTSRGFVWKPNPRGNISLPENWAKSKQIEQDIGVSKKRLKMIRTRHDLVPSND